MENYFRKILIPLVIGVFVGALGLSFQPVLACDFPDFPEFLECPELPEIPEFPELPECPEIPWPECPICPELPEIPECPEMPECPEIPECPECPEPEPGPEPEPCPECPEPPEPEPEPEPEPSPQPLPVLTGGPGAAGSPKLSIEKIIEQEFTNPGGTITFVIEIENDSSARARKVMLEDVLPEGFSYKDNNSSIRKWNIEDIEPRSKKTITYEVLVSGDVEPGIYVNTAELSAVNHKTIKDTAEIEVREPIVKGEEIVLEEPEPEPEPEPKPTLPHTGIDSAHIFVFLAFAALIIGGLGLVSIFIKKYKEVIQLILFGTLAISGFIVLVYSFLPLITFKVPNTVVTLADMIDGNYLIIPKIGVKIPIVEGEDESVLEKGAWFLPESLPPEAGGNTALAAHRFKYKPPHRETFYLLDKLSEGDLLRVFWQGKEYRYKVVSSQIVDPETVEVLEPTEKPTLTLITCHPLFSDQKRLVVRGEKL